MDHLKPNEILEAQINAGIGKANSSAKKLVLLGMLAGIYIALAAVASNMGAYELLAKPDAFGIGRLVAGLIFPGGLILVLLCGAELFTGNSLMMCALADGKISLGKLLRNWAIVWVANFVGSFIIAYLTYASGNFSAESGLLGGMTIQIAAGKVNKTFIQNFASGILCNILVCASVWLATGAKTTSGKALGVFVPIWMFVTAGFEHCVANMYYIPAGLLAMKNASYLANTSINLANMTVSGMFIKNLIPVTLGNIVGGGVFVGLAYYFALKERKNG